MRAYVVGNAVVDETFLVEAFPEEGASIHAVPRAHDVGGKGANQAVVLARAGVEVTLIAGVGDDVRANTVRAALSKEPLDARFVTVESAATDMSIIMTTPSGGNAIITTNQCSQALDAHTVMPVLDEAVSGDLMVLQGNLSPDTTSVLFDIAETKGMPVVFNPSPVQPAFAELLPRASMVFVNEAEADAFSSPLSLLHGVELSSRDPVPSLATEHILVTTLGDRGASVRSAFNGGEAVHLPAKTCPVVDTTGAGDTFQSAFVAVLSRVGFRLDEAALGWAGEVGAAAASISISRYGTLSALPSQSELAALLNGEPPVTG